MKIGREAARAAALAMLVAVGGMTASAVAQDVRFMFRGTPGIIHPVPPSPPRIVLAHPEQFGLTVGEPVDLPTSVTGGSTSGVRFRAAPLTFMPGLAVDSLTGAITGAPTGNVGDVYAIAVQAIWKNEVVATTEVVERILRKPISIEYAPDDLLLAAGSAFPASGVVASALGGDQETMWWSLENAPAWLTVQTTGPGIGSLALAERYELTETGLTTVTLVAHDGEGRRSAAAFQVEVQQTLLALDFTSMTAEVRWPEQPSKSFFGNPNDLLDYVSPSPKYVTNSDGVLERGTALRTDHDPVTGEPLGLLVEGQAVNLIRQSQEFSSSPWIKRGTATVSPGAEMSPDGSITAGFLTDIDNGSAGDIYQYCTALPGMTLAPSIWMRRITAGVVNLQNTINANLGRYSIDMALLPDEWTRITADHPAVTVIVPFKASTTGACGLHFRTYGDVVSFHAWGAQLEAGEFATSYIPTMDSQSSRTADNVRLPLDAFPWAEGSGTLTVNDVVMEPTIEDGALVVALPEGHTHLRTLEWIADLSTDGPV